jgi:hypothetical protein
MPSGADRSFIGYHYISLGTGMPYSFDYFGLLPLCLTYPLFRQNLDLSELLAFDPAEIEYHLLLAII